MAIAGMLSAGYTIAEYTERPPLCGCYAQVKAVGLLQPCKGRNHTQRSLLTKYIQKGIHPVTKAPLGKPRRLPGLEVLAFPSAERVHEGGGRPKPGALALPFAIGSLVSQPVWQNTGDDAEEAFWLHGETLEDFEEGFQGFDD